MTELIQNYLLKLARYTIAQELDLDFEKPQRPSNAEILDEERGVFVTLESDGRLRGCIGNISPVYPLEEGVRRNALHAAFDDPRFSPLESHEFDDIEIEISVLTVPKKLEYSSSEDLLNKLQPLRDGVILRKGGHEATYLPQVWEELSDKELFLASLSMKAGMSQDEWKSGEVTVEMYQAEVFGE